MRARLARLLGRDGATITRVLAGRPLGGERVLEARIALLRHLAAPVAYPLPARTAAG